MHAGDSLPLAARCAVSEATDLAKAWVGAQAGAEVIAVIEHPSGHPATPRGAVLHARFVSPVFGFADDLFLYLHCSGMGAMLEGKVELLENSNAEKAPPARFGGRLLVAEAQSQLRLGVRDLGVNEARLQRMWAYLRRELAIVKPPPPRGDCY